MRHALLLTALALLCAAPVTAQKTEGKANPLLKEAKITEATARSIALGKVSNGRVTESELEQENGKLIWSFDVKVPGKAGIEEVQVDAITGAVVAVEHETAAEEAKEEKADKAKAKAKAKKKP